MLKAKYKDMEDAVKHLQIGDIVLFRRRKGLLRYFIRQSTNSYWTHVALVFHVSRISAFPPSVLVVEASETGIEIHRLDTYTKQPHVYELGFKRMKGLTAKERDRFRGFFLDAVDTPYDHRRLKSYLIHHYFERLTGRSYFHFVSKHTINPNNFICTTFAQRAYYLAVAPHKRKKVIFRPEEDAANFYERMEFITPGMVAASKCTYWLYNPHL